MLTFLTVEGRVKADAELKVASRSDSMYSITKPKVTTLSNLPDGDDKDARDTATSLNLASVLKLQRKTMAGPSLTMAMQWSLVTLAWLAIFKAVQVFVAS